MPTVQSLEKQIWKKINELQNGFERQVVANYKEALNSVRAEISRAYEKYAVEGVLTKAEMSKYNRMTKLQDKLVKILGATFSRNGNLVRRAKMVLYEEAFFRYRWAIEQDLGLSINWGQLNPKTVERAVENELTKIAEQRLRFLGRQRIRREVTQGLIRGDSYPKMMKSIRAAINGNAKDALRIVRTEGQRAAVLGQQDQAKESRELGIEVKEIWDATLDARTRPEHGRMDGKEAKERNGEYMFYSPDVGWIDGPLQSGVPGFDINCRCRVREQVEEGPVVRRVQGEVTEYTKYDDWIKQS